jgi:hypothetical protein
VVHCPESASEDMLTRWTNSKLLWVHSKLALKERFAPRLRGPEFVTGESFCYLGRRYRLRIDWTQKEPLRFDGKQFVLRPDARPPTEHFRGWYTHTGAPWIIERVDVLAARTAQRPSRVDIRDLGFRSDCDRWTQRDLAPDQCSFSVIGLSLYKSWVRQPVS